MGQRAAVMGQRAGVMGQRRPLILLFCRVWVKISPSQIYYEHAHAFRPRFFRRFADARACSAQKKVVCGPFDKEKIAVLDECEDIAHAAQSAPYADLLKQKYAITSTSVVALLAKIAECEGLFGAARTAGMGSQTHTDAKNAAREGVIEAIDEFRTGARLSLKTEADLESFGVGVSLDRNEANLAQLAQTILDNPVSPTLRGITPDEMTALQSALDLWKAASQSQTDQTASSQGDRARANALFDEIEAQTRDIKIAIDGKFSYKKPDSIEARKLFHLPLKRPFAPKMG